MNKNIFYKSLNSNLNSFSFNSTPFFDILFKDDGTFFEILGDTAIRSISNEQKQYFHKIYLDNSKLGKLTTSTFVFGNVTFDNISENSIKEINVSEKNESLSTEEYLKISDDKKTFLNPEEENNFAIKNFSKVSEFKDMASDSFKPLSMSNSSLGYSKIENLNLDNTTAEYKNNKTNIKHSENSNALGITTTETEFYTDENLKFIYTTDQKYILKAKTGIKEGKFEDSNILKFGLAGKTIEYIETNFAGFRYDGDGTIQILSNEIIEVE